MVPTPDTQGQTQGNKGSGPGQPTTQGSTQQNAGASLKSRGNQTASGSSATSSASTSNTTSTNSTSRGSNGEEAEQKVLHLKEKFGSKLETIASNMRGRMEGNGKISNAVEKFADGIDSAGHYIKDTNFTSMGKDVGAIVRRYPIQSVIVGVTLGVLVTRAFKRSSQIAD